MKEFASGLFCAALFAWSALTAPLVSVAAQSPPKAAAAKLHFTTFTSGVTPGFSAGKSPYGIVAGRDGNVWFTELTGNGGTPGIGVLTPAGRVTEYPTGTSSSSRPLAIVAGSDKNYWYTDAATGAIGRITPQGHITLFKHGLSEDDVPAGLTNAAGGVLWFVSQGQGPYVGTIDARGSIVEVAHLSAKLTADPSLAQDSRGVVWLTANDGSNEMLVRIDAGGHVTMRRLPLQPGFNPCCVYETTQNFTTRADGSVWFANLFYTSARSGNHPLGDLESDALRLVYEPLEFIGSVARGVDNALWVAAQDPFYRAAAIGSVGPKGALSVYPVPADLSPLSIMVAPNGAVWMTGTTGNGVGVLIRATP